MEWKRRRPSCAYTSENEKNMRAAAIAIGGWLREALGVEVRND